MGYTVEKISGNQVKISFEIAAQQFDDAAQKAYLKVRNRVNIPGFRKGKAPRKLIENMYGEGVFYDDAFDMLFPDAYQAAVKEHNLLVVDRPEVDEVTQIGVGKDLLFTVKVFVSPDVELGQYKGVHGVKHTHKVTDEEIDSRIQQDAEKATTTLDVEGRAVEQGDIVNLDYSGSVDGVKFEGGTADGQTLEIGSNQFIPGFEEQMVGMNIGEERDLTVTFPTEYHAEDLAGKEAVFHVKVNGIQARVKPELDDDFAADVSEFSTFAEYRDSIVKELTDKADKNADVQTENALIQQVVDASDCDIPASMIEDEIEVMLRELKMRMAYQGLRYEDYLKYTGQDEDQVKEMYRTEAQNRVKMQLVLEAIRKAEAIEASEEDIEALIVEEAERAGREVEAFKASLRDNQMAYLKDHAAIRKVVDLIKNNAEIDEHEEHDHIDVNETMSAVQDALDAVEAEEE